MQNAGRSLEIAIFPKSLFLNIFSKILTPNPVLTVMVVDFRPLIDQELDDFPRPCRCRLHQRRFPPLRHAVACDLGREETPRIRDFFPGPFLTCLFGDFPKVFHVRRGT